MRADLTPAFDEDAHTRLFGEVMSASYETNGT